MGKATEISIAGGRDKENISPSTMRETSKDATTWQEPFRLILELTVKINYAQ